MPTPQTGTFRIKAASISSKVNGSAAWATGTGSVADADIILAANAVAPQTSGYGCNVAGAGIEATIHFLGDTTAIILNEGTVDEETLAFASLPAGFNPTSASVKAWIRSFVAGTVDIFFRQAAATESSAFSATTTPVLQEFAYDFTIPLPLLSIINNGFGFRIANDGSAGINGRLGFNGATGVPTGIYGDYSILAYTFTLNPVNGSSVDPGDVITITSDPNDPDALNLLGIKIVGVKPNVQTANLLTFNVPYTGGTFVLTAIGDGFQFTGSVILGSFIINNFDGSGIYVLVPGKRNDTIYNTARDGTTTDYKIPNPFGRTGFISG